MLEIDLNLQQNIFKFVYNSTLRNFLDAEEDFYHNFNVHNFN